MNDKMKIIQISRDHGYLEGLGDDGNLYYWGEWREDETDTEYVSCRGWIKQEETKTRINKDNEIPF